MSDEPQSPPATPTLQERLHAQYQKIRASDPTIKKHYRDIDRCVADRLDASNRAYVARCAIRVRETFLMRMAAEKVRKQTGIQILPGFLSPRENIQEYERKLEAKLKSLQEKAAHSPDEQIEPSAP